jgi:hypothetical protein
LKPTANQKSVARAIIWLVFVFGVMLVVLVRNRPAAKTVQFDTVCTQFDATVSLALNLNGVAQLSSAKIHGFEASVRNVQSATPLSVLRNQQGQKGRSLTLSSRPEEASPDATLTPGGGFGRMTVDVSPHVILSSPTTAPPVLTLTSKASRDIDVLLQSERLDLKEDLYQIPEIFGPSRSPDRLAMSLAGPLPGVVLEAYSGQPGRSPVRIDLTFVPTRDVLPLIAPSESNTGIALRDAELEMLGTTKAGIEIEGKRPSDLITDQKTNIVIRSRTGQISEISLIAAEGANGAPGLEVHGTAEAESVKQDDHELLPTFVHEILDKPYDERTYWLIALGFIAFFLFKVVDRAFEILLKTILPGG